MSITLVSKTTDAQFYNAIVSSIEKVIKRRTNSKKANVSKQLKTIILEAIRRSPEFESLALYSRGELAPELGFVKGSAIQNNLLRAIGDALEINFDPKIGNDFVTIILTSEKLLADKTVEYVSAKYRIEWLRWLVMEGTTGVIAGFHIDYNLSPTQTDRSRSKLALMEQGGTWSVPASFAGTIDDNFISRAVNDRVRKDLVDTIYRELIA